MIKEEFLLVDECEEDEDEGPETPPIDPNLEKDVKEIVEKLCDDVVDAEKQSEFVEAITPGGLTIKVTKKVADLAAHYGFNPFCYIRAEPLCLPKPQSSNAIRQRKHARSSTEPSVKDEEFEPSMKRSRDDFNKKASKFKPKRMKCITENCKVCLSPMDQRSFMPDGETFYCSTECIHKKFKQVRKALTHRDQIFVTDRKGRLHANYVPDIDSLEAFLLRRPNYEPCVRQSEEEPKGSPISMSSTADESRIRIRTTFSDQIMKRCSFHDIEISEKKAKELSHQVEYDLFEFLKSVRDVRYRNWCRGFLKFLMNSTSVFMDKLVNGGLDTARLVRIPDRILDNELHKMDEIEAAVEPTNSDEPTPSSITPVPIVEAKPKPSPLTLPFKFRSEPLKPNVVTKPKPVETGKSAIDDILGVGKDTTSKHMSHLYDANCEICKKNTEMESVMLEKVKKNKQEKEREKELKQNGSKEELVVKRSSSYTRKASRFEDITTYKQQTKITTSASRRNYSDDDNSPAGFGVDDDYEPPPPGQTPDFKQDPLRPSIRSSLTNHLPDSTSKNNFAFDSNRNRRRSRSPPSSTPSYRVPQSRPHLSAIDSNRISPEIRRESWRESWRQPDNRPPRISPEHEAMMLEDELSLVWNGIFDFPKKYRFKCEFSLVKNRVASEGLQAILPETMRVQGSIECKNVWSYLESLRSMWTKDLIVLLMHPPVDNSEYQAYVNFYTYLDESKRMVVVDVKRCLEIKDVYLFSLPPYSALHPSCDVGDGPGLLSHVQGSGNILAVVVKQKKPIVKADPDELLVSGKSRADPGLLKQALRSGREDYQMEQLPKRNRRSQSPYIERATLIQKLPEEEPPRAPFLSDIPIVGKSPFDSTPEKSPTVSAQSLNIDESSQNQDIDHFNESNLTLVEFSPPPPPPPDDRMEMSSGEEGEVLSPSERSCLPPPPMPPPMLNLPAPVPPPEGLNFFGSVPSPMRARMPLPPRMMQMMPPHARGIPPPRMLRGRGMPIRLGPMNGVPGPRGPVPLQRLPQMMMSQNGPPPRMPIPRLSDANMQESMRGRMPHPSGPVPLQRLPPQRFPPPNNYPPQSMMRGPMPLRRPMLRLNGPMNQGPPRGRFPQRMPRYAMEQRPPM